MRGEPRGSRAKTGEESGIEDRSFRDPPVTPRVVRLVEFGSTEKMFERPREMQTERYVSGHFG